MKILRLTILTALLAAALAGPAAAQDILKLEITGYEFGGRCVALGIICVLGGSHVPDSCVC